MQFLLIISLCIFVSAAQASQLPLTPLKTQQDMRRTALVLHANHPYTFFCQTPFSAVGKLSSFDCPYCQPTESAIKWLRIVPAAYFGKQLNCFNEKICVDKKGKWFKGIKCCEQKSALFNMMYYDLFNIVAETPQLKSLRRQYAFAPYTDPYHPNTCPILLNKKNKTLYIAPNRLGFIARTYLYMADTYSLDLSEKDRKQYLSWHHTYPPSDWEKERNQKIKAIQGNENTWVTIKEPM